MEAMIESTRKKEETVPHMLRCSHAHACMHAHTYLSSEDGYSAAIDIRLINRGEGATTERKQRDRFEGVVLDCQTQ